MIPDIQPKSLLNLDTEEPKYRLIRERDKLVKESDKVLWLEWNEEGGIKRRFKLPNVGRGLLMFPINQYFTWMTTAITEIIEQREDYVKFKTKNSNYELFKL